MKKVFYLLIFLSSLIYSQNDDICKFDSSVEFDESIFSHNIYRNIEEEQPLVLNVKFVIVRDDDGNNIYGIEEQHALPAIAKLNIIFNNFNIFFKYRGLSYYDNSEFLNLTDNNGPHEIDLLLAYMNDGLYDNNSIHVFVTNVGPSAFLQYSDVFLNKSTMIDILNNFASESDQILIHEFGHALTLFHIFEGTTGDNTTYTHEGMPIICGTNPFNQKDSLAIPKFFPNYEAEHVTRDPDDPDYNATTHGDRVVDTNATFYTHKKNSCTQDNNTYVNFIEHPDVVDQTGEMYVDITEDEYFNYMSYHGMQNRFTPGQVIRMREAIVGGGWLSPKQTTIDSLYLPYKTNLVAGNLVSREDLGNGFIRLCYEAVNQHYFQPGFDYSFNINGNISNFTVGYEIPVLLSPSNINIQIEQISEDFVLYESGITGSQYLCYDVPITKGKVTSFVNYNDPNLSIQELDSNEASDPNLIQQLENEKFHHIEKESESGEKVEKTIYK